MKTYLAITWLYFVRTWLYFPGEYADLQPHELDRYGAQIEVTEDGKYRVRDGFFLQVARTYLIYPNQTVELTDEEAIRYSDKVTEVVVNAVQG
jgi:hypothetical protein